MTRPTTADVPRRVLQVDDVRKYFKTRRTKLGGPRRHVHAVDRVSLSLDAGRTLGIVGESGCGKSTLGRVIVGLEQPDIGTVTVGEGAVPAGSPTARGVVQAVFQDPASALDPRMTVRQSIAEALPGLDNSARDRRCLEALEDVGLAEEYADRYPHELSGGQQQRVCVARAVVAKPELILLDEAVTALDASLQAQVLDLLERLQQRTGVAYVFISHDLRAVRRFSDRVAVMYLGQLVEVAPADDFDTGLLHPYSVALRSTEPRLPGDAEKGVRRIVLDGEPPSAVDPPTGCRFAARCPAVEARCREALPALVEERPGHFVRCVKPGVLTTAASTPNEAAR
ncbi:ABC transporter ATP-binding protein [Streptomyces sp. SID3343]|uniref:oligopeptide/dipeptide ABC transporter ATP-binding protein n=1 Tax=Streptomyces sp. SID3343 TaxID=2690260 RepID=UPI0013690F6E|nr:ABC transporter ATP-binding protein [Streptomyces sp. SID3343]MYW00914.1 ATP-binding cassette domain-containing protein [Streptomyces sp. SID3343]